MGKSHYHQHHEEHAVTAVGEEADARRRRDFVSAASRFGAIFALCVGIWLISGAGAFWPLWVLVVAAFVLGRRAVDAYRTTGDGPMTDELGEPPVPTWR